MLWRHAPVQTREESSSRSTSTWLIPEWLREPGHRNRGASPRELLDTVRRLAGELPVIGADVVEVSPPYDGPGQITAFLANRVVLEVLNGMAERKLSAVDARSPADLPIAARAGSLSLVVLLPDEDAVAAGQQDQDSAHHHHPDDRCEAHRLDRLVVVEY